MVQWTKPPPVTPASHVSAGSSPGCDWFPSKGSEKAIKQIMVQVLWVPRSILETEVGYEVAGLILLCAVLDVAAIWG